MTFFDYALAQTRAVAKHEKLELTAGAGLVYPSSERDGFANMIREGVNFRIFVGHNRSQLIHGYLFFIHS